MGDWHHRNPRKQKACRLSSLCIIYPCQLPGPNAAAAREAGFQQEWCVRAHELYCFQLPDRGARPGDRWSLIRAGPTSQVPLMLTSPNMEAIKSHFRASITIRIWLIINKVGFSSFYGKNICVTCHNIIQPCESIP